MRGAAPTLWRPHLRRDFLRLHPPRRPTSVGAVYVGTQRCEGARVLREHPGIVARVRCNKERVRSREVRDLHASWVSTPMCRTLRARACTTSHVRVRLRFDRILLLVACRLCGELKKEG